MNTWVDYIRDNIKAHIAAGRPLPAPLTLHGLSGHYAVSIAPIRRAVRELIADGYLCRRENGRLTLAQRRIGRPSKKPAPRAGAAPRLHGAIRRALAESSLAGNAVFVREEETAERFGVQARRPCAQVFHELAGAGLLEHIPRHGWGTAPLSAARALDDYVRVREVLELEALDAAWPHLEDERLRVDQRGQRPSRQRARLAADRRLAARLPDREGGQFVHPRFLFAAQPVLRNPVSLGESGPRGGDCRGASASDDSRCPLVSRPRLRPAPHGRAHPLQPSPAPRSSSNSAQAASL